MDARYQREKEFHDQTFGDGSRSVVDSFYVVVRTSFDYYEHQLESVPANYRVLEYGCGPGSMAFFLGRRGVNVTGIDISDVAIRQAQERAQAEQLTTIDFRVGNAEALDFPDASFDIVCGRAILHHLDLSKAMPELTRVLKPSGRAIFVEPLGHNPVINLYRRLTPHLRTVDEHPLLMSDLKMMQRYFGGLDSRFFHLQSLLAVPFAKFKSYDRVLRFLDRADQGLFKLLSFTRRYAWSVVLTLSSPRAT